MEEKDEVRSKIFDTQGRSRFGSNRSETEMTVMRDESSPKREGALPDSFKARDWLVVDTPFVVRRICSRRNRMNGDLADLGQAVTRRLQYGN